MNIKFQFAVVGGDALLEYIGDEPTTDSEGMDISIAKWKEIVLFIQSNNSIPECGGTDTCGLCMLHVSDGCLGCPIRNTTGFAFCESTPHEDWEVIDSPDGDSKEALRIATKELEFLQQIKYDMKL